MGAEQIAKEVIAKELIANWPTREERSSTGRPVYADMEPPKEHVEEMHKRLESNQKEKEMVLAELSEFIKVHGREVEKAKNLLKRFGVES
jgi:predicted nuclease with TOPRIM domain